MLGVENTKIWRYREKIMDPCPLCDSKDSIVMDYEEFLFICSSAQT